MKQGTSTCISYFICTSIYFICNTGIQMYIRSKYLCGNGGWDDATMEREDALTMQQKCVLQYERKNRPIPSQTVNSFEKIGQGSNACMNVYMSHSKLRTSVFRNHNGEMLFSDITLRVTVYGCTLAWWLIMSHELYRTGFISYLVICTIGDPLLCVTTEFFLRHYLKNKFVKFRLKFLFLLVEDFKLFSSKCKRFVKDNLVSVTTIS
jgi:hypothetical protein